MFFSCEMACDIFVRVEQETTTLKNLKNLTTLRAYNIRFLSDRKNMPWGRFELGDDFQSPFPKLSLFSDVDYDL